MLANEFPSSEAVTLRLALRCDLAQVRPMSAAIREFLRANGAAAEEIQASELAIAEACNNAIKYVTGEGRAKDIEVEVLCGPEQLELRVNDNTRGFDLPKKIDLPGHEDENGRGLYLIQSLMDRVQYYRGQGENCLIMRRKRNGAASSAPKALAETEQRLDESERIIRDMAEELSFCYESLSAIFRCSAELGKSNDLEDFARRLLTDLSQITSAEWFVLRMAAKGEPRLEVFTSSENSVLLPALELHEAQDQSVEAESADRKSVV